MELLTNVWAEEAKEIEEKKRREARERRAKDSTVDRHRYWPQHSVVDELQDSFYAC